MDWAETRYFIPRLSFLPGVKAQYLRTKPLRPLGISISVHRQCNRYSDPSLSSSSKNLLYMPSAGSSLATKSASIFPLIWATLKGFGITSSIPLSLAFAICSPRALAVTAMIGK